jgi:vitamin B12 transporter
MSIYKTAPDAVVSTPLKNRLATVISACALLLSGVAQADTNQEIVVTANRMPMPVSLIGSSVTVITAQQIKESQQSSVSALLRTVPGLTVVKSGGPGGSTSVFIRGANSDQTMVMIDGVEVNDPISPNHGYDFANLSLNNIQRIEIIRGPQSTLYGSNAMGGVINIITKKGKKGHHANLKVEAGSYRTFNQALNVSGATQKLNYSLGVSHLRTAGISAASSKNGNSERDNYSDLDVSSRVNFIASDQLDFDAILHWNTARFGMDDYLNVSPYNFADDLNLRGLDKSMVGRLAANLSLMDDQWRQTLGVSFSKHHRVYTDGGADAAQPIDTAYRDEYNSKLLKFDWQNNIQLSENNTLVAGAETQGEEGSTIYHWGNFPKKSSRTNAVYLQDNMHSGDTISGSLGARYDHQDQFNSKVTYQASGAYAMTKTTRLKASLGTGYKAPSLSQLFDPTYGNPNLKPEESTGADISIIQQLNGGNTQVSATYFWNKYKNLINSVYNASSRSYAYENVDKAKTQGVELAMDAKVQPRMKVGMTYTYTDTENLKTHKRLTRRPLNKANAYTQYGFTDNTEARFEAQYVGTRDEFDGTKMSEYLICNLLASSQVTPHFRVFGRVENLFNKQYVEVKGYGTMGVAAYAGVNLSF